MKQLLTICLLTTLLACNSTMQKQADLKKSITPVLNRYVKSLLDSTDVLDSLQIIKVDTLTSKKLEYIIYNAYSDKLDELKNSITKLADAVKQLDAMNDYVGMPRQKIAPSTAGDITKILAQQKALDSLLQLHAQRSKTADSTNFLNYLVTYHIVYSNKAGVQKNGDLEDIVTPDFKIKQRGDYLEKL